MDDYNSPGQSICYMTQTMRSNMSHPKWNVIPPTCHGKITQNQQIFLPLKMPCSHMFTQDGIDTQFTSHDVGQIDCSGDLDHPSLTVLVWLGNSQSLHELPNYKSIHQVRNYEKGDGVSIYVKKIDKL